MNFRPNKKKLLFCYGYAYFTAFTILIIMYWCTDCGFHEALVKLGIILLAAIPLKLFLGGIAYIIYSLFEK